MPIIDMVHLRPRMRLRDRPAVSECPGNLSHRSTSPGAASVGGAGGIGATNGINGAAGRVGKNGKPGSATDPNSN